MKGIFFIYFIGVSIFLILPKPWLDKKIERWFEAISTTSPKTLKYFYLFPFFAGIFSSLGLTSMIVFALYTGLAVRHLASLAIFLSIFAFIMWATREMYIAFRDARSNGVKPKAS